MVFPESSTIRPNELFDKWTTLNIPSTWVSLANFCVFDIFLITLVFTITSHLAGRLNGWSLSDGTVHPLYIVSPPVVGGGLSSIRRGRGYLLAFVRMFSLALVLISNACIEGSDGFLLKRESRRVLGLGNVKEITETQYENKVMLRSGCLKLLSNGYTVYSELRLLPDDSTECITDNRLLKDPFMTSEYVNVSLDTGKCEVSHTLITKVGTGDLTFNLSYSVKKCERATLRCLKPNTEFRSLGEACRGIVKGRGQHGGTYLCDEDEIAVGSAPIVRTCLAVENLDFRRSKWTDAALFLTKVSPYIVDKIMAMLVAVPVTKSVLAATRIPVTYVSSIWFLVITLKLLMVTGLALSNGWLWKNGFSRVAHDEQGLADLITRLEDYAVTWSRNSYMDCNKSKTTLREICITGRQTHGAGLIVSAVGYNELRPCNEQQDAFERHFW